MLLALRQSRLVGERRIGTALQSWAIVIGGVGIVAGAFLLVGLFRSSAQRRFAGGVILRFPREHDAAQAALDRIEFGGGDDVFGTRGKDARDFFLCVFDALGCWRMRGKDPRDGAGAALLV